MFLEVEIIDREANIKHNNKSSNKNMRKPKKGKCKYEICQ